MDNATAALAAKKPKVKRLFMLSPEWGLCEHEREGVRCAERCRQDHGNTKLLFCAYHGWSYKNTGEIAGLPGAAEAYPSIDRTEWGLLQAPRVDSIHGLVFACLDPQAEPLADYLGDMAWYLDFLFAIHPGGLEIVGQPQRWIIPGNWKSGAENVGGDNYHTAVVHKSLFDQGVNTVTTVKTHMLGYHVQAGNGHTISLSVSPPDDTRPMPFWALPAEITDQITEDGHPPGQVALARSTRNCMGTVWPNFSFIRVPVDTDVGGGNTTFQKLWLWRPLTPDTTEVWEWVMVWKNASDAFKKASYDAAITAFGPSGLFEQDDTTAWRGVAGAGGTYTMGRCGVPFNYKMGIDELRPLEPAKDFPGPGLAYATRWDEGFARHLYARWLEYMRRT
jgi:phenylpropionate dioxygenase-like ring-hydroxylating dioxygenase large terminal subunit